MTRLLCLILLCLGSPALGQTILHTEYGPNRFSDFGESVSDAGDTNGDGVPDLIVGAPDANDALGFGRAVVLSGDGFGELFSVIATLSDRNKLGYSVSDAGDVDGDGRADVLIGAYSATRPSAAQSGVVLVHSGRDGSRLHLFQGPTQGEAMGWAVSGAGDVNQDGVPDFVFGAPRKEPNGNDSGGAYVHSGSNGDLLYSFDGGLADEWFGLCVSGAGDVNMDGHSDLILGAPGGWGPPDDGHFGRAIVISGLDGSTLHVLQGTDPDGGFGTSVADAGDLDQDGHADLLVGAPYEDGAFEDTGSVRAFSGFDGTLLHSFSGEREDHRLGQSVACAGDVDRDGVPDIVAGAPGEQGPGLTTGGARIFLGQKGTLQYRVVEPGYGGGLGTSVDGLGDLDQDGLDDIVVGARSGWDPVHNENRGLLHVIASCGSVEAYGTGCPGSGGFVPQLAVSGCPRQGGTVTVSLTSAPGGVRTGLLLVGGNDVGLELGGGCTLLTFPFTTIIPMLISGSADGQGVSEVSGDVPPIWPIGPVFLQAVIPDAAGFKGYTLSNGVRLSIP